ncbi:MAG: PAS domain-containing protein [Methanomassiliicoccus sp.]|nr:PAS domain-containing protein [Methanomassiliicoccus sp.]
MTTPGMNDERAVLKVIKQLPGAILLLSADGFRVKYMSDAYGSYHPAAFNERGLVGRRFADFVGGGENNPAIPILKRISESGKGEEVRDYPLRNREGDEFWVDWCGSPIDNGTDRADVLVQIRDITDRRRMEEALRQKSALFEAQTAVSPDGILVIDENNKRVLVNRRIVELYKVPQHIMDDEDDSLLLNHVVNLTKNPEEFLEKVTYLNDHIDETSHDAIEFKNGMVLDRYSAPVFGKDGKYYGRTWMFHDITSLRRAEEALKVANEELERKVEERTMMLAVSEALLKAVLGTTEDLIFLKDRQSRWLLANPATLRSVGRTEEEVLGKDDLEIYGDHEIGRDLIASDRRVMETGVSEVLEEKVMTREGERVFLTTKSPYRASDGSVIGIVGVARDITERKRSEEDLIKLADELKRSNEELQQFAYVASHDLQEPLRMVTNYLGLLDKKFGGALPLQAREYMSTAVEGAERMRQLVNDLLLFSRVDSQTKMFTCVDMYKVAETVKDELDLSISESEAQVIIEPLPSLYAEETQMIQLLTNLVSNAIKFRGAEKPRIEISAISFQHEFIFCVKDNGIGIDPQYADRLFKMFSRLHTKEEYPGTGIGLAICKKIVERHGGRIWFESEPGKGTTFFFAIPI